MNLRRITHSDTEWHERFFAFVETAFRSAGTFRPWAARGGWRPGYEIFVLERDGQILSTAGRQTMRLIVDGQEHAGYQLGAVASSKDHRNRGLSRRLLTWLLSEDDAATRPIILFGNRSVLDFYPRFGFTRIMQTQFTTPIEIEPGAARAPTLDLDNASDRARLAELCGRARAPGTVFSACDYYPALLWLLTHKPRTVFWLDELDAAVVASVEDGRLILHDVIATRPFDLRPILPRVTPSRVRMLEFGFGPEAWWPSAEASPDDDIDSPFFVRGLPSLPVGSFRFPDLAQT
ncbi:MAG: GNAT family N-acetyltransferase [Alphaproteobacteria bacterium]|nr:GNAT family N-acetyltransferase [Alphaproteobacteria bacterium]